MNWNVSDEAIAALINMSGTLQEIATKIHQETEKLKATFEENKDGLGAHSDDIIAIIEDIEASEEDANIPVKKLVLKLQRSALARKIHNERNTIAKNNGRSR